MQVLEITSFFTEKTVKHLESLQNLLFRLQFTEIHALCYFCYISQRQDTGIAVCDGVISERQSRFGSKAGVQNEDERIFTHLIKTNRAHFWLLGIN